MKSKSQIKRLTEQTKSKGLTAKQFAWYYLVTKGDEGVVPSYYGGLDPYYENFEDRLNNKHKILNSTKQTNEALKDILTYGVDWKKTTPPRSDSTEYFNGTFAESSLIKETLSGDLYLNNGTKQHWFGEGLDISNVFEIMANIEKTKSNFETIFGNFND